ncbi:MAG: acetyl-CoA carboxylase biotin carboxyl carrier protein [Candidatus Omnitrophica bacterium]|nr:acetyl-CoA carboxylase biotin carboxyl carrier protein [Candidatus Omnitrophota bacterium]
MVNLKELKELIALMNEHQLVEIELEREGMKVRLRKGGAEAGGQGILVERIQAGRGAAGPEPAAAGPEAVPKPAGMEIKSPMVGTFYRAPAPEAPPFVEVGQEVEPGQVLCIIEAMKLMNEIKAEIKGRILQILVENGQPVQFGQALFLVEPG